MIPKVMTNAQLEAAYDVISEGIDAAGAEKQALFLAKLAFALANLVGDSGQVAEAVEASLRDL